MAKNKGSSLATMAPPEKVETPAAAAPEQPQAAPQADAPPEVAAPGNWKFNLRSKWTVPILTIEGAASEEEARKELHRLLDQAIWHVERTR